MDIPTITTARLVLRPLGAADEAAFAAMYADPEVTRHLTADGQPLSRADAWRSLAMLIGHWQLRGFGIWAVAPREEPSRFLGRLGLHMPEGWPDLEVGWALAREHWGRGYAFEGAAAAVRYAFTELDRPRVVSLIHPDNVRSRRLAERLGERRVGEWMLHGRSHDLFALERDEWRGATPGRG